MNELEKITRLEIQIAEQAAVIRYVGLRWLGFIIVSSTSILTGLIGGVLVFLEISFGFILLLSGLLGSIVAAFRFRRTHKKLKELEKEHLRMQTKLAELRGAFYRSK